jgi:regulator of PEP synthase PpsR (kinase-PPPase family)
MAEIKRKIVILSDATGDTADKVVRAALRQFEAHGAAVELFPRVRDEKEIEDVVERAAEEDALLVHTMVNQSHRELLQQLCDEAEIDQVDLIGPLIGKLAHFLDAKPRAEPGGLYKVNDEYFMRIEAVEFAVKNDDGQHPRNLHRADLVLVGISRTSKTPLSTYLAQRGHKVANVPIVMGIEPPPELFAIDQRKVYALDIQPQALFRIRQARLQQLGMPADTAYGMKDHIEKEIAYARQIFEANSHWPVLDVTDRAIEETAGILLSLKKQREQDEARRNSQAR